MPGVRKVWQDLRVILGQLVLAALGQPVAGQTPAERENNAAQRAQLRHGGPASARAAAAQLAREAARVAALQPADRARRDGDESR